MKIGNLIFLVLVLFLLGCKVKDENNCSCCEEEVPEPELLNFWTEEEFCPLSYKWSEGTQMNLCHYPSEVSAKEFYDSFLKCEERKEGCQNIRECNIVRFNHTWMDKNCGRPCECCK